MSRHLCLVTTNQCWLTQWIQALLSRRKATAWPIIMCVKDVHVTNGELRTSIRTTMLLTCSPSLCPLGRSAGVLSECCCIICEDDAYGRLSSWVLCALSLFAQSELVWKRISLIWSRMRSEPLSSPWCLISDHHLWVTGLFLFFPLGFIWRIIV